MANHSQNSIKYSTFSIIANSLTAGSLYTYPIFSSSLQSKLNFSVQQVSSTASIGIFIQYLCAGLWGSLADKHGSARLSFIAAILFFLGLAPLSYSLSDSHASTDQLHNNSAKISTWLFVTLAYSLCGAATTASYFAALTSSTKIFGSTRPSLSVAGPSTLFGLSPLILSFLGVKFFSNQNKEVKSSSYLACLAILTTVVNLIGSVGLAWHQKPKENSDPHYESDEQTPLLGSSSPLLQTSPPAIQSSPLIPSTLTQLESSSILKSSRSLWVLENRPERDLQDGTREFLKNPTVWLLGITVLLSAGPAEMTITSIGLVVDSQATKGQRPGMNLKAQQVQLISFTNTVFRLLSGWTFDRFCGSGSRPRLAIWATGCLVYSILCFSVGCGPWFVPVLSTITGCFYGMIFTLAPSLVATIWSISSFGRNFGIISYFSATGSLLFTSLFGTLYDPFNPNSIESIYRLAGFAELLTIFVLLLLYRIHLISQLP